jgi:hypothetical protein
LIKTEPVPIEIVEKVEIIMEVKKVPQSARKLGSSLTDFFSKTPVGQMASPEKIVLKLAGGSIDKKSPNSKKIDSAQKVLF